MKKHFVEFLSPGTFVSESDMREIDSWDIEEAKKMAKKIKQRYGATPYGFRFVTRSREDNELDSRVTKTSSMYFLGGKVLTLADVKARNDEKDKTLIWNMEMNKYDRIIENTNSYKITLPLNEDDVVLDWQ